MKILIIGIDGGTWRILDPLIKEGYMPTLKYLVDNGTRGTLRSTIPPITAPAWTSFMTGVSPGKHGIFEFNNYDGKYGTYFVNNTHIKYKTIWEVLSEFNKRIISINVPMTYPPFPVRGLLVTGLLTPGTKKVFTYPSELSEEIREEIPDYRIMTTGAVYSLHGLSRFISELKKTVQKRTELAKYLLDTPDWDVAMVHFQSSDVLQHFVFHCIDPSHPFYENSCRKTVIQLYKQLDSAIEELHGWVERRGEVLLVVMSDHGFRPIAKTVDINALLFKYGFASQRKLSLGKKLLHMGIRTGKKLDLLGLNRWLLKKQKRRALIETLSRGIGFDFSKTRAFSINGWLYGNIFINLKGREPEGIVEEKDYEALREEIKKKFEEEIDPENGKGLFKVLKKEEAFGETDFIEAPDLLVIPVEGYEFSTSPFASSEKYFRKNRPKSHHTGNHDEEGILVLNGHGVKEHHSSKAKITDVLPTLLWYLGLPIPEYMEGNVLNTLFSDKFSDDKPIKKIKFDFERDISRKFHEEEEELKKTLEGLGYL